MTREQVKQFITQTFGIDSENVTDEMITSYLNNLNGAIKSEKDRADKLKADSDLAKELQAQLDAINEKSLSDVEKANKETEKANAQIADLQKQVKQMETMNKLANLGITGEQATTLFAEDGGLNFDVLGQIISDREAQASSLKEKEILASVPNPQGGHTGKEKSEAEAFAENIGKTMAGINKASNDILAQYTN